MIIFIVLVKADKHRAKPTHPKKEAVQKDTLNVSKAVISRLGPMMAQNKVFILLIITNGAT